MWNEPNAAELSRGRAAMIDTTGLASVVAITGPVFDININIKALEIGNSD